MSRATALQALLVVGALLLAVACSPSGATDDLRVMVPNAPGGGYDTTARVLAQVLEEEGVTGHVEVFNLEGASGVVGLARTAGERGNPDLLMMMGLGVVGALFATDAAVDLREVTPVARLVSDPEIVAVASGSRFTDARQLLDAWTRHPQRIRVGGGSSTGGPDHLAAHLLARAIGIAPGDVRYTQYDGGGPLLAALYSGEVDLAISSVSEYVDHIASGELKVLAVTSRGRVPGVDAPSLRSLGVDLQFSNWRGLVAPPGLSEEQRQELVGLVARAHDTASWREAQVRYGWQDAFLTGDDFGAFLRRESRRVARVLADLGLAGTRHVSSP